MTERKLARIFHRMATGLQIAQNEGEQMRFMTLTTAPNRVKKRNGEIRTITESFELLRSKIKWSTIKKAGFKGFKFNRYYCLRTEEGNGVLHIIFWGRYIPIDWLRRTWYEIHGAIQADVRMVSTKRKRVNGLVGYLLDRYLLNQKIKRMSYGWRWAWLGFCKSWKNVKQTYGMMHVGRGELGRVIHRRAQDALYTVNHSIPFGEMFSNGSINAWHCQLWGHRITSIQKKLAGAKSLRWYEPDIPKKTVKKPEKKERYFGTVRDYAEYELNKRSALFGYS